jgi:N-acetylglucosamine kinase-like BadF-type ATPase
VAEPLFVGIDAGGSKTVCLIGDASRILGRGTAGPGNPNVVGMERHVEVVCAALEAARAAAGDSLGGAPLARAWLGVAGSEWPDVEDRIREAVAEALAIGDVHVSHDAALILPAAGLSTGVALVAGTGSAAFGVGPDGRSATVGGWGHVMGDEGSGHELGRLALRAVTQAADGRGPATALTERLLRELGVHDPIELRRRLYPAPPAPAVAALARVVLQAADDGDPVACRLVEDAARDLAAIVRTCAARVGLLDAGDPVANVDPARAGRSAKDGDPARAGDAVEAGDPATDGGPRAPRGQVEVVAAGGILGPGSPVLRALTAVLATDGCHVSRLEAEPALGALALARRPEVAFEPVNQRRR